MISRKPNVPMISTNGTALLLLTLVSTSLAGCGGSAVGNETELRQAVAAKTGVVQLAAGVIEVSSAIEIPTGARGLEVRGDPAGSTLRVADGFAGRAVFVSHGAQQLRFAGFTIEGNRAALEKPAGLPPSNVTFFDFYENNGIAVADVAGLTIEGVKFSEITNYAVIVSKGSDVLLENLEVRNSGSRNERGRNNASGGILLENGTTMFTVRNCVFENIRGNGIWTHSRYESPRNSDGDIAENHFKNIARDAIQVGHATRIRVEKNTGSRIGFPAQEVDIEGGAMPVGVDTAGNTDHSVYADNRFEEINGKCIDLDGFHHGEVRRNTCVNRGQPADYPSGHFGIVMNNSNPDMESEQVIIEDNEIDGTVYGGIFVIGSGHRIVGNHLHGMNRAACREQSPDPRCNFWSEEPALLRSGIYLGRRAERPAQTHGNVIRDNEITGFGMAAGCLAASPGLDLSANDVAANRCSDEPAQP
jgi:hypothetical protein